VTGEGARCEDDGFSVLSNDVLGFGSAPRWSLIQIGDRVHLATGSIGKGTVYSAKVAPGSKGVVKRGDAIVLDVALAPEGRGKTDETVRASGQIACQTEPSSNRMPQALVEILRKHAGSDVRRYSTYDFGRERDVRSISAVVAEPRSRAVLMLVRSFLPPGFVAFIGTTQWLGDEKHDGVEIVVGPGRDQFDILRLAHSDAVNYDMTTESLVKKLRDYHRRVPIDIFHAETDTIELRLLAVPNDPQALAKDLYDFCPDIVDQGLGSVAALEAALVRERHVLLWWD
jgi:hypothetical protein